MEQLVGFLIVIMPALISQTPGNGGERTGGIPIGTYVLHISCRQPPV